MTYLTAKTTLREAGIALHMLTEREHRNLESADRREAQVQQLLATWS